MNALASTEFTVRQKLHLSGLRFYFHAKISGFYDECKRRFNIKLWKTFTDCFNCLPIAAIIDEKIFCCHGGLSPDLQGMDQIRRISRPTDVPDTGLLCDLLWSDPDKDVQVGKIKSFWRHSQRAYSREYETGGFFPSQVSLLIFFDVSWQ